MAPTEREQSASERAVELSTAAGACVTMRVDERGGHGRMVKLIYCISKKPEMTVEQFQTYWRETHAPIAGAIPGLRRYVQCHVVPELYARQTPAYDGAAELWFDDLDALRSAMQSPETRAALEDEKNFIDHARVASFVTIEKPVIE